MSTLAKKRLMRDFRRLQQDPQPPPAGISGAPQDNNILLWNAVIFGPDDTPRDGVEQNLQNQWSPIYVSLSLSTKPLLSRWIQSFVFRKFSKRGIWISLMLLTRKQANTHLR
ncbi:hypothetical protein Bca52824_085169 [Brassica carinata]|uniref:UBC core domain-containing protein n=1 Tax=Brassica carinata TaxID=52824 RepID=A0A8X7TMJ3_BRACI|nr:hypothetical protein Bca52824_085169 [Brassica carinata]